MDSASYRMQIIREMVSVARAILDENISILEGCRELDRLSCSIDQHCDNPLFDSLRGFLCETDHYPIGATRTKFAPSYLIQLDQEISEYVERCRTSIRRDCSKIIQAFDVDGESSGEPDQD